MSQPLILTLKVDEAAQVVYEDLRRRYFPPARNLIPAHLTLFHQLPDEERTYQELREMAESMSAFALTGGAPRSLGRGAAVFFESKQLVSLHSALATVFHLDLIAQDRQRFRPHIVVQNKVDPEAARQTVAQLSGSSLVEPEAIGLTLWRYLGGPWEHVRDFSFRA